MILAWHNEPELKASALERLREHQRLETIVQGSYWSSRFERGCQLGCLTHTNRDTHGAAELLFGIAKRIGYWLEAVFEGLPSEEATQWVIESTEAIPVGAELSRCHHHFCAWLMGESGLMRITELNRAAIEKVRDLHLRAISGDALDDSELSAARSESLWASSESESESAAAWASAWAARSAWRKIAAKSLEIFRSAPVPGERESERERSAAYEPFDECDSAKTIRTGS